MAATTIGILSRSTTTICRRFWHYSRKTLTKRHIIFCKIILTFIIIAIIFRLHHHSAAIDINDDTFHQLSKCPACYGTDLCHAFINTNHGKNKLTLESSSIWNRFMNTKNIFYGTLHNKPVILKKLATDWELTTFDSFVCSLVVVNFHIALAFPPTKCDVGKTLKRIINEKLRNNYSTTTTTQVDDIIWELTHLGKSFLEQRGISSSDALQCNNRRFQSFIFSTFYSTTRDPTTAIANLILLLLINPEPIFLNIFNRISPAGPFPRYLGACGRITVQEYVGPSLATFSTAPLHQRLEIAKQLLHFAHNLTTTSQAQLGFNYFLTDVSFENFAVSKQGSHQLQVKLVDVEGILLTDPQSFGSIQVSPPADHQRAMYANPFGGQNGELRFSIPDLCSQESADHNFYSICECLLSEDPCTSDIPGGLLYDIGTLGVDKGRHIRSLIQACQIGSENRVEASYKLVKEMDNVLTQFKNGR